MISIARKSRCLPPSLSHTQTGNSYCCRLAFICQLIPSPTPFSLCPSLSHLNKRASVYSSIRLFVCLLVASRCLFVCRCRRMQHIFTSAPPRSGSWPLLAASTSPPPFSAGIVFSGCRLSVYFRSFPFACATVADPNPHCAHSFVFPLSPLPLPFSYFAICASLSLALLSCSFLLAYVLAWLRVSTLIPSKRILLLP